MNNERFDWGIAHYIAGKGIANPAGALFSAAMMLDWLGEKAAATLINTAVPETLSAGNLTPDFGGNLTTQNSKIKTQV